MAKALVIRRRVLGGVMGAWGVGVGAGLSACAPVPSGQVERYHALFVSLGPRRTVAVLEPGRDRVVGEASLAPLGWDGTAGNLVAAPNGYAAVLPLGYHTTTLGVIGPAEEGTSSGGGAAVQRPWSGGYAVAPVRLGTGSGVAWPSVGPNWLPMAAVDGKGRAYVVVADQLRHVPTVVAVVDLASATVLGRCEVAAAREVVTAIAVTPDGNRLYLGRWVQDERADYGAAWMRFGAGALTAHDVQTGRVTARIDLPDAASVRHVEVATLSSGAAPHLTASSGGQVLLASVRTPDRGEPDYDWSPFWGQNSVLALDPAGLGTLDVWALEREPSRLLLHPDGQRLVILSEARGPGTLRLSTLHLGSGTLADLAVVPDGVRGMALAANGGLYVLDAHGHRLWRFDAHTNRLMATVPLDSASVAIAAC